MTIEEIEEEKFCIKELKKLAIVFFQDLKIKNEDSASHIETKSLERVIENLEKVYANKSVEHLEKISGFLSIKYRDLVKKSSAKVPKHRFMTLLSFILNQEKIRYEDTTKDFFSLLVGYRGYKHFKSEHRSKKNTFSVENSNKSKNKQVPNPLEEDATLKEFFRDSCYLYAYDEDLCGVNKETNAYRYYFPSIDRLILSLERGEFKLENVKTDLSKKEDHKKGIASWCRKPTHDKNKANAIDIIFQESRTKLILRIHIPSRKEKNTEKFNLLLGAFLIAHDQGEVAMGSIVLQKVKEGEEMKPEKFDFGSLKKTIKVESAIQGYLFDRYKNWLKVPSNQYNISLFEKWLNDKNGKNYTKQQITAYDFLITHPRSVIPKVEWPLFKKDIDDFFNEYDSYIDGFNGLVPKQKTLLKNYIAKKQQNNRFFRYPDPDKNIPKHPDYNRFFLLKIVQSLNVVIIIPKYKYERTSSIFLVIGYCIALNRRTFVFFEDGVERPKMLSEHEDGVNLFVDNYSKIEDIAELLVTKYFRKTWIEFACKYTETRVDSIPQMD